MPDTQGASGAECRHYYQLLYDQNRAQKQAFIDALLQYVQASPATPILQPGCYDGSFASYISGKGFSVTAIDESLPVPAQAVPAEGPQFFQHDSRLPFWINYFELVFHLFTSFGYYHTQREHDNAIRTLCQSLRPGGLYVMDYINTHFEEEHFQRADTIVAGETTYLVNNRQDEEAFYKDVEVARDGRLVGRFHDQLAKFSPGDFTDMFAYNGLQVQELFGNYALGSYNIRTSPRLVVVAKKIRP